MRIKNIYWLFAALMVCIGLNAQAQSAVHPKAYYDAITYEWTGDDNVTHTSSITEEATDPHQIIALLTKVYCDPRLPGPTYTAYDEDGNRERRVDYGAQAGGWNISASDVTEPYEEGYTLLMVSVSDNVQKVTSSNTSGYVFSNRNQLVSYIRNNVKSVQLLTDGLRVGEGMNAGTCFNISGTYDRFFMLGKGQSRQKYSGWVGTSTGEMPPFLHMFEQFSPTTGSQGSQTSNFYSKMMNGDIYNVIHDCASVIENEHYFSMHDKNTHEEHSLTGLNIFIPDYRLLYWEVGSGWNAEDGRTMNPYQGILYGHNNFEAYYAQYNQAHAPQVGIYTIKLTADATPAAEEHTYTVDLDWTSSLNTMANGNVPQDYTIYIVRTDEDGNEYNEELTVVTNNTHYEYTVPQDEHSYTITYVVKGQPNDGEHDIFIAWSNTADVIIPGWNDFLALSLDHFESDFDKLNQYNYYRNFLKPVNEDVVNGLTRTRVQNGENSFTLYRFDTELPDVKTPVAVLTFTVNNNGVRYNIEYENQYMRPNYNVNVTTNGNVSVNNDVLNLSNILFVDQFNVSTELNDHPGRYGYVLVLNNSTDGKSTNTVEVPVFKTNSTIDGFYTEEEVLADVEPTLTPGVKNANVRMNLSTNSGIDYYTLDRGSNAIPNQPISKLQRRTDGTYLEMLTFLPEYIDQVVEPGEVTRYDDQVITGVEDDFMAYQPVIWTFGEDRVKQDGDNSYGSPMWTTGVGNVNVHIDGNRSTTVYGEFYDEDGNLCNMFNPIFTLEGIVPELASVEYEPYMYRVWRLCNDVRGYGRNSVTGVPYNDPTADRSADKLIVEEITSDPVFSIGDDAGLLNFGAKATTEIAFRVRFYYKKVAERALKAPRAADDAPMFYVVEKTVPWSDMPTGVIELQMSNEVNRVYYNAQGIKSDKPFDGVNIVVTRYSDGTVKTTKVVH